MKGRGAGVFVLLFSLIFITIGTWLAIDQANALRSHRPTDARVVSTRIEVKHGDDSNTYLPKVLYRYTVEGKQYECDHVNPIEISSGEKWAIGVVGRYKPGTATLAWYNPAQPGEAYLVHEASIFPYIFILFPMIFSCIGLAMLFQGRPPVLPTVVWNVVGIAVAAHYFGVGGKLDLGAKIAFMIYGLIGAVLIYATLQMRRNAALSSAATPIHSPDP